MIQKAAPILLLVALAGCAAAPVASSSASDVTSRPPVPASTQVPTADASVQPATGAPSWSPSSGPSPTIGDVASRYRSGDVVTVTGDGLAVREGPGTAFPLVAAAHFDGSDVTILASPYRLSAGEELVIHDGPLAIDGRDWYSVGMEDYYFQWVRPEEPGQGVVGWIAARDEQADFIRLVTPADDNTTFETHGVGSVTVTVPELPAPETGGMRAIFLVVGGAQSSGSCDALVTDSGGAVLIDDTVRGWADLRAWWPGDADGLQIDTDCSWSLRVGIYAG